MPLTQLHLLGTRSCADQAALDLADDGRYFSISVVILVLTTTLR